MFATRQFILVVCCGFVAASLTACGPSPSVAENSAPKEIHGEPIKAAQRSTAQVATSPANPAPAATVPAVADAYPHLGFDKLASYNLEVPDDGPITNQTAGVAKANAQIPATVKAFDETRCSIKGFMLPLKVDGGAVTEFLLMKDQSMCCYGNVPKITEWISVKTAGKGMKAIMDQPVSIEGTLHVGATMENGYLVGIYRMEGEKLVGTADN